MTLVYVRIQVFTAGSGIVLLEKLDIRHLEAVSECL